MSSLVENISASRGLFKSLDAITNLRAFLAVVGSLMLALVSVFLFDFFLTHFTGTTAIAIVKLLKWGIITLVLVTGFSVAGFAINDQLHDHRQRQTGDMIVSALQTVPHLLGLALVIGLAVAVVSAIIFLALWLCKIPFIGPLLYVIVFPVSVLIIGAGSYAAFFTLALSAPAIWEGNTVMETLSVFWAIIHQRLSLLIIHWLLMNLLVGVVSVLVMTGLTVGMVIMSKLSGAVLSFGSMGFTMSGLSAGVLSGLQAGNAYLIAHLIGCGLILTAGIVLPVLVGLAGLCIVFTNLSREVSGKEYASRFADMADAVRRQARAVHQRIETRKQQRLPSSPKNSAPTKKNED